MILEFTRVEFGGRRGDSGGDLYMKKGNKHKALSVFGETTLLFSYAGWKLRSKRIDAWAEYIVEGRDYNVLSLAGNGELLCFGSWARM